VVLFHYECTVEVWSIFDIPELVVPIMISLRGDAANNEAIEQRVPSG
jgi:hypothetical protein